MKFLNLCSKYKFGIIFSSILLQQKSKINKLFNQNEQKSDFNYQTNNKNKKAFDLFNKIEDNANYKQQIKEFRSAALFEDFTDLFDFSDRTLSKEEMLSREVMGDKDGSTVTKKKFEEEYLSVGAENSIQNRNFIQVDVYKAFHPNEKISEIDELDAPEKYFQKILIFRINDRYYATGSFCGYDLTDLKKGVFLGNKIICPTCLSSYNIEIGINEEGPNTKYLSTFPVGVREKQIIVKVPKLKIPLFSLGSIAGTSNELDPRHYVLIGDNETVFSCLDSLTKIFTGQLSIITHKTGNDFIDSQKLIKSFFPIKMKQARMITNDYLEQFNIKLFDEKCVGINAMQRLITLSSGNKIPFDKVLIAVGSKQKQLPLPYNNVYTLDSIQNHANIHNEIIKKEIKSIALLGNDLRTMDMASSLRRYLDSINKIDTKIYIIPEGNNFILEKVGLDNTCFKIIEDYLSRNRIFLFRGINDLKYIQSKEENKITNITIEGGKYLFNLPVDLIINDFTFMESNCDFIDKIKIEEKIHQSFQQINNVLIPDDRLSLHSTDRYPHVFTAGSCSAYVSELSNDYIFTDNFRTNFQLGYIAALNMLEVHYPFDDVNVNMTKILDKNLHFIGNENTIGRFDKHVIYSDKKKEKFAIYLFEDDVMKGALIYGFNNLHVYIREGMRMSLLPNYNFSNIHNDTIHKQIYQEINKFSDKIECFKHKALGNNAFTTDQYNIEDQGYFDDIMKRGLDAYNNFKEEMDKKTFERKKKLEEDFDKENSKDEKGKNN